MHCTCTYGASWLILTYQYLNHWATCTRWSNKNKFQILKSSMHWFFWNKKSILYCIFVDVDCFMIHILIRQLYLNKTVDSSCDLFSWSLINEEFNTFYIKCLLTCFYVELMIHVYVYKFSSCIYCCITQFYSSALQNLIMCCNLQWHMKVILHLEWMKMFI